MSHTKSNFTPSWAYTMSLCIAVSLALICVQSSLSAAEPSVKELVQRVRASEEVRIRMDRVPELVIKNRDIIDKIAKALELKDPDIPIKKRKENGTVFFRINVKDAKGEQTALVLWGFHRLEFQKDGEFYVMRLMNKGDRSELFDLLYSQFKHLIPKPKRFIEEVSTKLKWIHAYRMCQKNKDDKEICSKGNWITFSDDGGVLFVADASRGAFMMYRRGGVTGRVLYMGAYQWPDRDPPLPRVTTMSGMRAKCIEVSPDSKHVYVCGGHHITVFPYHHQLGVRKPVQALWDQHEEVTGLSQPEGMAFSPDAKFAYVAVVGSCTLNVFSRSVETGKLKLVEMFQDDSMEDLRKDGTMDPRYVKDAKRMDGLEFAQDVAISPDGRYLYVASFSDSCLLCFERNKDTGRLKLVEMLQDQNDRGRLRPSNRGLQFVTSLHMSPDGKNIYTTGIHNGVSVWQRDGESGKLTFLERVGQDHKAFEKDPKWELFDNVRTMAIHPDGSLVYVPSKGTITVFDRSPKDGTLTIREVVRHDDKGIDGIRGIKCLAVSPDGKHLYVGTAECPLVVFATKTVKKIDTQSSRTPDDAPQK